MQTHLKMVKLQYRYLKRLASVSMRAQHSQFSIGQIRGCAELQSLEIMSSPTRG